MTNNDYLRLYKAENNLTAQELADLIGVKKRTVESWLSDKRNMPDTVYRLFVMLTGEKNEN